jgi:hypothetical protein
MNILIRWMVASDKPSVLRIDQQSFEYPLTHEPPAWPYRRRCPHDWSSSLRLSPRPSSGVSLLVCKVHAWTGSKLRSVPRLWRAWLRSSSVISV